MSELKPCDFCGASDAYVERADLSSCYVICNNCGARGPTTCDVNDADAAASENDDCEPGEMAARRAWNTRHSTPADPALREAGWQPIETAPRDGSEILAYSEHGCTGTMLVRFIALCDFLTDAEADEYMRHGGTVEDAETADWFVADFIAGSRLSPDCYPTHWQPLPPLPSLVPPLEGEGL